MRRIAIKTFELSVLRTFRLLPTSVFGFRTFLLFIFYLLLFNSCSKEKVGFTYDDAPVNREPSLSRIINVGAYTQVVANGDTLTDFNYDPLKLNNFGTSYFPKDGILGNIWTVPQDLFIENRATDLLISTGHGATPVSFSIPKNQNPTDYYMLTQSGVGQHYAVQVPRDLTPSSHADHFKIRILNLCKSLPPLRTGYPGYNGPLEDLKGSMTLVYADGTPVDDKTTRVSIDQLVSDYIELPYGSYQFKIITDDGRQVSANNYEDRGHELIFDPATSRVANLTTASATTALTYAPLMTYQPGGVYTIVVAPLVFYYISPVAPNVALTTFQNGFCIVQDMEPSINETFARIQAVNVLPGTSASFKLNGRSIGNLLNFGIANDYGIFHAGSYELEAVDERGNQLADTTQLLEAGKNYSVWLFPGKDNDVKMKVLENDLSGNVYANRFGDDGSYNYFHYNMAFGIRFLNLSPDIPYLSFTISDGQSPLKTTAYLLPGPDGYYQRPPEETMYNLQSGMEWTQRPYVWWGYQTDLSFQFRVYRSSPGIVPGVWADDIPNLSAQKLVQRPALYEQANRAVPPYETGIYSIAVIGRTGSGVPEEQKAKMIIVKHNK